MLLEVFIEGISRCLGEEDRKLFKVLTFYIESYGSLIVYFMMLILEINSFEL